MVALEGFGQTVGVAVISIFVGSVGTFAVQRWLKRGQGKDDVEEARKKWVYHLEWLRHVLGVLDPQKVADADAGMLFANSARCVMKSVDWP